MGCRRHLPAGGYLFSPGEVERGEETAFQSEAFAAQQCPRHGLIPLSPLLEGKRDDGKLRKGKSSQEEGADPCGSISPAQPVPGWVKLRMPQLRGPTAGPSELGNSRVSPHFSPFSQLHWVDFFKGRVLSRHWIKTCSWPLPRAELRAHRSPWRHQTRLAEAGQAKPIPHGHAQAFHQGATSTGRALTSCGHPQAASAGPFVTSINQSWAHPWCLQPCL